MKVEIIDIMGNDLYVVNAARVSYAKVKEKFDDSDDKLIKQILLPYLKIKINLTEILCKSISTIGIGLSSLAYL